MGEGRSTITESRPYELIRIKLGRKTFVTKAVHLVMSMDRRVGGEFDKGLGRMKAVVEAAPKVQAAPSGR